MRKSAETNNICCTKCKKPLLSLRGSEAEASLRRRNKLNKETSDGDGGFQCEKCFYKGIGPRAGRAKPVIGRSEDPYSWRVRDI